MKTILVVCALFSLCRGANALAAAPTPLDLLKSWVSISSGSADVAGVGDVQKKIAEELKSLGFQVVFVPNPDGALKSGPLLVAELAPDAKTPVADRAITLLAHADTVFEKLNPFTLSEDGKIARGSGVADDKGGIVVGVSALREFLAAGGKGAAARERRHAIRFLVTPSEETGSNGFREKLRDYSKRSAFTIGLEPARENGNIVSARKGARWIEVTVTGREAHAGVDHAAGVNACHVLAQKLDALQKLTDYKTGTTVSIGHIEGGKDKYNIVCGTARAKIDSRFATREEEQRLIARIERILKPAGKAKIEARVEMHTPPFVRSPKTESYLKAYFQAVQELEHRAIRAESTGGAGDVNDMDHPGALIVDGLGPVGGGYHTAEESVDVASLTTRSKALARFLADLDRRL